MAHTALVERNARDIGIALSLFAVISASGIVIALVAKEQNAPKLLVNICSVVLYVVLAVNLLTAVQLQSPSLYLPFLALNVVSVCLQITSMVLMLVAAVASRRQQKATKSIGATSSGDGDDIKQQPLWHVVAYVVIWSMLLLVQVRFECIIYKAWKEIMQLRRHASSRLEVEYS